MTAGYETLTDILLKSDDIALVSHINPDGDTLGSAFALCYALRDMGKRAEVLCSDAPPEKYHSLMGEVPKKEPGFEPRLIVSVDTAAEELFGEALEKYRGRVDICVDHHPSNTLYARLCLVQPDAAATGEVVYYLIKAMGAPLTSRIAVCLFIAISTDTGGFRYSNTTSRTLAIASELYRFDVDFGRINRVLYLEKSRQQVELERLAYESMRFYRDGLVASVTITLEDIKKTGATSDDIETLSNIPRYIRGVETGFAMRETAPGLFKISARSGAIDVSKVCALFGGGGHVGAAGCTIAGECDEVRERFAAAIMDAYTEDSKTSED